MRPITNISIIGTGNLASQLGNALVGAGIQVDWVVGRNLDSAKRLATQLNSHDRLLEEGIELNSDLILVVVADDAIYEVSSAIGASAGIIAHCSGSRHPDALHDKHTRRACFYPLQTFTPGDNINWKEIPILIQSDDAGVKDTLFELAHKLSEKALEIDRKQKEQLHLAAVLVNNYTNALYSEAADLLHKVDLDFGLLIPLIKKTGEKLNSISPRDAQTGPAKRHDKHTLEQHLALLDDEELKQLYSLLAKRIMDRQD